MRARRDAFVAGLSDEGRDALAQAIADRVALGGVRCLAGYVAVGGEADATPLIARAAANGVATALPHVMGRADPIRLLAWRPGDPLEPGPFGLLQPRADAPELRPDLILTPLVGFDRALYRLGQGAGHYDRLFTALPDARRVGLAWNVQFWDDLPVDPWDVPLHAIATETDWISAP